MVTLRPVGQHWILNEGDDPKDLCSHGKVEFRIGTDALLDPAGDSECTTSAAALYLLRTLSVPHTRTAPVGDHLFPCCGFAMYDLPGQADVVVCGCLDGADFEVGYSASGGEVVVRSPEGREWRVTWAEWRGAVFEFADRVSNFYAAGLPKMPAADDAAGFAKFLAEWARRRGAPLGLTRR